MADPSPHNHQPDRGSRGGSWARALDRVRKVMKRRRSSSRTLQTVFDPPAQEDTNAAATLAVPDEIAAQIPETSEEGTKSEPLPGVTAEPARVESMLAVGTGIEADEDVDDDDRDDLLLPMFSSRAPTSMTDTKARDLFAKYNMKYQPRGKQRQQEPPTKIRRVEKPVRLRVHWTCHECSSQFGIEKVCASCGHRRCRDCVRHPPKRAQVTLDTNRPSMEGQGEHTQEDVPEQVPTTDEEVAEVDPDLQSYRQEPAAAPLLEASTPQPEEASPKETPRTSAPVATAGGPSLSRPLEIDDDAEEDYANLRETQYSIYTRPREAIHTVMKPKAQTLRRTCHECSTPMQPTTNYNCPNCGHAECNQCTQASSRPQRTEPGSSNHNQEATAPLVRPVKRVYRKPRQRVRYTCEHCSTLFVDSDRCNECGHERCHSCTREPPKRHPHTHDPEVIRAVADRLAAYGGGPFGQPSSSTHVTASAG